MLSNEGAKNATLSKIKWTSWAATKWMWQWKRSKRSAKIEQTTHRMLRKTNYSKIGEQERQISWIMKLANICNRSFRWKYSQFEYWLNGVFILGICLIDWCLWALWVCCAVFAQTSRAIFPIFTCAKRRQRTIQRHCHHHFHFHRHLTQLQCNFARFHPHTAPNICHMQHITDLFK